MPKLPSAPAGRQSWFRRRRGDLLAVAVLALMTLVVFWKGFVPPGPHDSMIRGDAAYIYQPYYQMAADEVRAGRLPLWNPYILMGAPFHASLQPALLYPGRWPMFFMDYVPGFILTICLHYFLGAVAAYLFMRAAVGVGPLAGLLGAMSIAFGGLSLGHASHPNYFLAYPWFFGSMLCLWLTVQRGQWRWIVPGAACIGLMALIGAVHLLLVLGVLLGAYAAWHAIVSLAAWLRDRKAGWAPIVRPPAAVAAIILLGAMIGAAQMLPAKRLAEASVRKEASWEFINMAVAEPGKTGLLMAVPFYYGDMRLGYYGEFSRDEMAHYVGIIILVAAAAGLMTIGRDRHLWALVVLGLVGIALGAGKTLPFYKILYNNVGPFRQLRNPTRIFWLTDIALSCLAAVGVQRLLLRPAEGASTRRGRIAGVVLGVVILATLVGAMVKLRGYAQDPEVAGRLVEDNPQIGKDMWYPLRMWCARNAPGRMMGDPIIWLGVATAVLSAAAMSVLLIRKVPAPRWVCPSLVALLAADLFFMSWGLVMYDKLFWLTEGTPPRAKWLQHRLGQDPNLGPQRYAVWLADNKPKQDDQIQPNRGMQFGLRNLVGTGGGIVDSPQRSLFLRFCTDPIRSRPRDGWPALAAHSASMRNLACLRYVFVERAIQFPADEMGLRQIVPTWQEDRYRVYENPSCLPAAFFTRKVRQVPPIAKDAGYVVGGPDGRPAIAPAPGAIGAMATVELDPRKAAFVYDAPPPETADSKAARMEVTKIEAVPGHWAIHTDIDAPAQLVISEGYNAGWRCEISGKAVRVYRTFDQLMSVPVPAGTQTVLLTYDPPEFRQGVVLTFVGIVLAVGLAVTERVVARKRRKAHPTPEPVRRAPGRGRRRKK